MVDYYIYYMISRIHLFSQVVLVLLSFQCFAQGSWIQIADYGGGPCSFTAGGVVNGKAYVVCNNDLWEYDAVSDTWNAKADFPGSARVGPSSFVIDDILYFGTGNILFGPVLKDWWKYDPSSDTWVQLNDFAGVERYAAVGFTIESKGYITTGYSSGSMNDLWEYDPASDTWTQKTSLPDAEKYLAAGFSLLGKGYLITGYENPLGDVKDVWEYDPISDSWLQKGDFAGVARRQACAFSSSTHGYLATGGINGPDLTDAWEYDPVTDTWGALPDLPADGRRSASGFVIEDSIYVGIGFSNLINYQDFWKLNVGGGKATNSNTVMQEQTPAGYAVTINNNPADGMVYLEILSPNTGQITVAIYDVLGKLLVEKNADVFAGSNEMKIDLRYYLNGMYLIAVKSAGNNIGVEKLMLR